MASRTVYCEDAIAWLRHWESTLEVSMLASLPDKSEFPNYSLQEWKTWFKDTAALVMSKSSDLGVSIFFQSDIKVDGIWVDKSYLCQKAAESIGHELLFHKIICRAPAGTATFGRPGYSHLLCFSKSLRLDDLAKSTADVFADNGDKTWTRGMGLKTCLSVAKFVREQTSTSTLVNPFCGEGSMLAAANYIGLDAIGIERSPKRAERSRVQGVNASGSSWEQYI